MDRASDSSCLQIKINCNPTVLEIICDKNVSLQGHELFGSLCEEFYLWHHSLTIRQPSQHRPDQCKFLFTPISTTQTTRASACRIGMVSWYTERLKFDFVLFCFCLFCYLRLLLKELLSAVHCQNQMASCLSLLWTAHNTVFC